MSDTLIRDKLDLLEMSKYKFATNKLRAEISENKTSCSKQFINPKRDNTKLRIESTLSKWCTIRYFILRVNFSNPQFLYNGSFGA